MNTFTLTDEQVAQVRDWLHGEVYPLWVAYQKRSTPNPTIVHESCWEIGYPYEGAIGGGVTYEFTPTSIGTIERVKYPSIVHGEYYTLDVTDYDCW